MAVDPDPPSQRTIRRMGVLQRASAAVAAMSWQRTMRAPTDVPPARTEALLLVRYEGHAGETRDRLIGWHDGTHWMAETAHGPCAFDIVGWWPLPPLDLEATE